MKKMKSVSPCSVFFNACALGLCLTAVAHSATIAWSSNPLTGASDVRAATLGINTVIAHVPVPQSAVTVNGVTFGTATTGGGVTMNVTTTSAPGWTGVAADSQLGTNVTSIGGSTAYKELLEGTRWAMNTPNITIEFVGLTLGQEYEVRVWAADYRSTGARRSVTVDGGTTVVDYNATDTANTTTGGGFFIGSFTADATVQSFTLTGRHTTNPADASAQFNALQLSSIPEPSVTLLGGIGVLAMLRRRRP